MQDAKSVRKRKRSFVSQIAKTLMSTAIAASVLLSIGCEMDTYMDPSSVARRIERTPARLPILDRLAVIEPEAANDVVLSEVQPNDLEPTRAEYALTLGDVVSISIFELIYPQQYSTFEERIDETGAIRLPVVDRVMASGLTGSQLEEKIADALAEKQILFDALVSIDVLGSQKNTYTVLGQPGQGSTRFGVYNIPRPDFRVLEAIALAGGIDGRTKNLLIIRTTQLKDTSPDASTSEIGDDTGAVNPLDLLNDAVDSPAPIQGAAATAIQDAVSPSERPDWIYVDGQWVRAPNSPSTSSSPSSSDSLSDYVTQRVVRVPYQELVAGRTEYNIVIRPGDIIRVPDQTAGFVYAGGFIGRPGAYTVPGENELTITQLVLSAGGFSGLAIPERAEIRRRLEGDREAIVRLDLKAVFDGTAPNFYLKPNDEIIVGTNFWATPLAIVRNGFRFSYGFGFVADRNFSDELFTTSDYFD